MDHKGRIYINNLIADSTAETRAKTVMAIPPNVKYKDMFLGAHKQAREDKRGLWKN